MSEMRPSSPYMFESAGPQLLSDLPCKTRAGARSTIWSVSRRAQNSTSGHDFSASSRGGVLPINFEGPKAFFQVRYGENSAKS